MLKEKTMNTDKNIILLRSFFAVVMVFALTLGFVLPTTVCAEVPTGPINYMDLDYIVKEGVEYNKVVVPIPEENFFLALYNQETYEKISSYRGQSSIYWRPNSNVKYYLNVYPLSNYGLDLSNIPEGTRLVFDLTITVHQESGYDNYFYLPNLQKKYFYTDSNNIRVGSEISINTDLQIGAPISVVYELDDFPTNAANVVPFIRGLNFLYTGSSDVTFEIHLSNVSLEMEISNGYWEQWLAQQMGDKLDDINGELGDVNDKLDDTNDKLDGVNDKLDTLPEDVGNEMQGVIDKENDKAESSGNKFVNQILDKLPDPSTEVLGSLKGLTDSMAYTGTDCKLQIPALVIPAIDGLFPETEIWGGTEFSFSDYLSFLPPALLIVVQSLFTIAIVLFCVYELKGIISYCLTLNDKKGG